MDIYAMMTVSGFDRLQSLRIQAWVLKARVLTCRRVWCTYTI